MLPLRPAFVVQPVFGALQIAVVPLEGLSAVHHRIALIGSQLHHQGRRGLEWMLSRVLRPAAGAAVVTLAGASIGSSVTGAPGIEQVLPQALVNQAVPGEDHCSVPPLADVLGAGRAPSQGSWKGPAHGCQLGLRLPFHVVPVRQRKLDNGAPLASVTRPGASDEKLGNLLNHTSRFCPVKNFLLPTGGDSVNPR